MTEEEGSYFQPPPRGRSAGKHCHDTNAECGQTKADLGETKDDWKA